MSKVTYVAKAIQPVEVRTIPSISGLKVKTLNIDDVLNITEIVGEWIKHDKGGWSPLYIDNVTVIVITSYGTSVPPVVVPNPPVVIGGSINGNTIIPFTEITLSKVAFTGDHKDLKNAPTNATITKSGYMSPTDKANLDALVANDGGGSGTIISSDSVEMANGDTLEEFKSEIVETLADMDLTSANVTMADGKTLEQYKSETATLIDNSSSKLASSINVLGVTQGAYSNGNNIPAGTALESIIKNMLTTIIPPTYTAPTISISGSGTLNVEAGTSISPVLTPTFNQNDGGVSTSYILGKNGATVLSNPTATPYSDPAFVIGDTTINYQATSVYNAGPIKNDNAGNPSPSGSIPSGTKVSNIVSYSGKRNLFYGTENNSKVPADSSEIRSLTNKTLGVVNGANFTMNVPAGAKFVCIAYLASLQNITQIKSVNVNNDIKDVFTLVNISVADASGANPVAYKVYYYNPAVAFPSADTLQVII